MIFKNQSAASFLRIKSHEVFMVECRCLEGGIQS